MENITQDVTQNETVKVMPNADNVVDVAAKEKEPMTEVIIGIPANTAMMRVTVLTVNDTGIAEEKTGEFNFEQLLASRAKVLQLMAEAENGGKIDGGESGESGESSGAEAEEEAGQTEEEPGREGEES